MTPRQAYFTLARGLIGIGLFIAILLLASCTQTVQFRCPPLAPPPSSTIDALETQARKDANTAAWVIQLDRHYQKLDACQ